jgi:membrane-associated protease RseP (regulator of RpoE activity)
MAESIRTIPPGFEAFGHSWANPTAREWRFHIFLLFLTVATTTLSGVMLVMPQIGSDPPLNRPLDYLLYLPIAYVTSVIEFFSYTFTHPHLLVQGVMFSMSLLTILLCHEMGHYLASRHYRVDATLPYFIPAPPLFLAGTFGAFIKIKSPIPTRRALFDIGLAGPFAGFLIAIPIAVIGILTTGAPVPGPSEYGIYFNDPLLFRLLARLLGVTLDPNSPPNVYLMAAWIGLLVTSLNLMPVGQLDGGHGTFAVFGPRAHKIIGRVAFVVMAALSILGFWWHGSPSGFLYTVLLAVMLRVRHPEPPRMEALGGKRTLVAILALVVFALCFLPFPITIR